jgi:hypothetical protein
MKQKLFLLLLLLSLKLAAQVHYEKGYVVTNDNQRIECLIKNKDWLNNPKSIDYKLNAEDSIRKGNFDNVKEFGISGISSYVKAEVDIDQSPTDLNNLSWTKNPIWSKEKLYLRLLVNGKGKLYSYKSGDIERLFYSVNDSLIQQLIFKEYIVVDKSVSQGLLQKEFVTTNNGFRQQLWKNVRNEETSYRDALGLNYNRKELINYFRKFDKLGMDSSCVSVTNGNRSAFNLKIKPGIDYSSVSIKTTKSELNQFNADFGNQLNFRLGLEAEWIFPFNKNTWSLFIEPTYQNFNSSNNDARDNKASINLNIIDLPIGIRHYFFLNDNFKIHLNALFNPVSIVCFDPEIHYTYSDLNINPMIHFAIGGGFDYKRLSLEFRYYPNISLTNSYMYLSSDYHGFSFIAGYKILDTKAVKKK